METEQSAPTFRSLSAVYLRQNKLYWAMILTGMLGLIGITWMLDSYHLFKAMLPAESQIYDKPFLIVIVLLLLLTFYLKRRYLMTHIILDKARSKAREKYGREQTTDIKLYAIALTTLRNIYMRIWTIANIITVVAFLYYSLAGMINNFFYYAVAGVYAIVTTFPSEIHVKRIYSSIFEK